ncbi:MAG: alpha/beta fold hydrolase [Acidobacteriota bacterium]|nr:alpha/beta fold hydrolase [Acidobacteriota bacterium]
MTSTVRRFLAGVVVAGSLLPSWALAQALPNLAVARVRYNTAKTNAKAEGELKAQIDAVDREISEATRLGRTGEVRRLLAKGTTLVGGRPWTPDEDFRQSLVLRAERVFADAARPFTVRLEQIYAPSIELAAPLAAAVSLRPLLAQPSGSPETTRLANFSEVPRDLRESPFVMDLDVSGAPDGPHELAVDVMDGPRAMGRVTLRVAVQRDLDRRVASLDAAAEAAPEAVRADIRYPLDFMRKVNRGLVEMGGFDLGRELAAAETIGAASAGGRDPFAGRTGDFERHYVLDGPGEIMPYRVWVPTTYRAGTPTALVIALHGLGANEDSFFDSYQGLAPKLAEQHGFLLAAPLGFRVDGFYGSQLMASGDPAAVRRAELSEQDVLEVVTRMRAQYSVDAGRIYLIGHSMGAIGTWVLGAKHPDLWAALGLFSGFGAPATVARMKHIPQIVVHGDNDATVNVNGSRAMVAEMKKNAMDVTYIEVPGGNHLNVVVPNLPRVFDFLATRRRTAVATQQ